MPNSEAIYIEKLRNSGLRPTKQRLQICEVLFDTEKTFHFTINDLVNKIKKQLNNQISLATVYNTVHAFEKKGYLKQIPINSNQTYFDTNVSDHHHFYDLKEEKSKQFIFFLNSTSLIIKPPTNQSFKSILFFGSFGT